MLVPQEFIPFVPLYNLVGLLVAVAIGLWINNKTRSDLVCLLLGGSYMVFHYFVFSPTWDEWLFFFFGLTVGYITDYWGVKSKKWKYHPWDPSFGYSGYVGFAWGMVCMFTYSASRVISLKTSLDILVSFTVFLAPMIIAEWKYGETRRDQYFLFARAFFTFLAFFNNLPLLLVAIFVGTYIEWTGVYWLKNWIYIDNISFIFLSFGYSLVVLTAKLIVDILTPTTIVEPLVLLFYLLAAFFYAIDTFWAQKKVVKKYGLDKSNKAQIAAENFE